MMDRLKDLKLEINSPVKVSVAMIAYNVEKYILEAIESVLNQRVSYRVELVIGEDCSADNTLQIALAYQEKYPNIIKVLRPEKNQGLTPNCISTINSCSGEYVALLDSDDFWTNENKLNLQIDFLEKNTAYAGSGHQSFKIYDDRPEIKELFGAFESKDYVLNDVITHRKFHTSSFVFRKSIWDKTGGIPSNISSNERALFPMVAIFGKIKYFKDNMCVYRFSGFGLSSRIDYKELETDLNMLPWLKGIDTKFPRAKYKSFLHLCIYTYGVSKIPFPSLVKHYVLFVWNSFSYFPKNMGDLKWGTIDFVKRLN